MGQSVIKHPRKIYSQSGGDPTATTRITNLENNEYKILYFQSISAATGTITKPINSTILLDQFYSGGDAVVETLSTGQPTGQSPLTVGGAVVSVSSFDALGNYTLSGTPSAFDVALVYIFKIKAIDYANIVLANQLGMESTLVDQTLIDGSTNAVSGNAVFDAITGAGTLELLAVISQLNNPPAHVSGERYLINTAPTGAWVGFANNIAESNGSAWTFTAPVLNNTVYLTSIAQTYKYNGTLWAQGGAVPVLQNGNTLGVALNVGTNDNFDVNFKRNGVVRWLINSSNALYRASGTSSTTLAEGFITVLNSNTLNAFAGFQLTQTATNDRYSYLIRYGSAGSGNFTGTSIQSNDTLLLNNGGTSSNPYSILQRGSVIYGLSGHTGTNLGTRLDTIGFRIGVLSTLHTANTVTFQAGVNLTYVDSTCVLTQSASLNAVVASVVTNTNAGSSVVSEVRVSNLTYSAYKRMYGTGYATSGLIVANLALDFTNSIVGQAFINTAANTYFKWAIGGVATVNEYMALETGLLSVKNSAMRMLSTTANSNNVVTNNKILKVDTTDATVTELTTDGLVGSAATNRIAVPSNSMMSVVLNIACKQTGSANSKQFLRQFRIINNAGATTVGTITVLGTDDGDVGLATAAVTISANDTNDCLKIEVTGVAATILRWTAFVVSTEVVY